MGWMTTVLGGEGLRLVRIPVSTSEKVYNLESSPGGSHKEAPLGTKQSQQVLCGDFREKASQLLSEAVRGSGKEVLVAWGQPCSARGSKRQDEVVQLTPPRTQKTGGRGREHGCTHR